MNRNQSRSSLWSAPQHWLLLSIYDNVGVPTYPRFPASFRETSLAGQAAGRRRVDTQQRWLLCRRALRPRRSVGRAPTTGGSPRSQSRHRLRLNGGGRRRGQRRSWAQQLVGDAVATAQNAAATTVSQLLLLPVRRLLLLSLFPVRRLARLPNLTQALQNGVQHEVKVFNVELEIIGFEMPGQILNLWEDNSFLLSCGAESFNWLELRSE